ncbi:MAG: hypothetical protein PHV13_01545 [Candidatus ainarchaeum sp.]|nr:hypothetical protein [Candidatus ainarchaeum sp.]
MIAVSLGFGICMTAGMFAVAYALQNPQLQAVAKEELAAFLFTLFLLMFWLGCDATFNGIASGLVTASLPPALQAMAQSGTASGLTTSHLDLALSCLDVIFQKLRAQYIDLYLFEAIIGFLSTMNFPIGTPLPAINMISFSIAPFTGLVLLSNAHTQIVKAVSYLITVVWAKQFIVIFARDVVPLMLLPLGLVMRAFPFFRTTGSSIIALSFALYFVLPFSVILSSYLIFDVFQPADFVYTPSESSFFKSDKSASEWESLLLGGRNEGDKILEQFDAKSALEKGSTQDVCAGNDIRRFGCSTVNLVKNGVSLVGQVVSTVFSMWKFMMGMSGDFFSSLISLNSNPLLPTSTSAGLYYFIIREVTSITPFIILVTVATVFEVIFTVTLFRDISLLIGGEAELIGLTKVI